MPSLVMGFPHPCGVPVPGLPGCLLGMGELRNANKFQQERAALPSGSGGFQKTPLRESQ